MSDMTPAPQGQQPPPDAGADSGQDEVSVEICVNKKTGEVKYGLENDDPDTQDDDANMQTAKDLEDAFAKAKGLLQQAVSGQPDGGAQQGFEQGFASTKGPAGY
jgi:hypothetical protein